MWKTITTKNQREHEEESHILCVLDNIFCTLQNSQANQHYKAYSNIITSQRQNTWKLIRKMKQRGTNFAWSIFDATLRGETHWEENIKLRRREHQTTLHLIRCTWEKIFLREFTKITCQVDKEKMACEKQ